MLVERRRSAFPLEFIVRVAIAWALVSVVLVAAHWSDMESVGASDGANASLPGFQSIDQLIDIPIWLVLAVLTPFSGAANAELTALAVVSLAALLCAMMLVARIAWRLMGDEEASLAALVMAISIPVMFELASERIDFFGWQIVCVLAAVNALMSRQPRIAGVGLGASCALLLAISTDGLLLVAAIFGVLALRWLRDRNARHWLVSASQSLAIVSGAVFALSFLLADPANASGAAGPLHLGIFAASAVAITVLSKLEPLPPALRLGGVGFVFLGSVGAFLFAGPLGLASVQVATNPALPIWNQGFATILQYGVTPIIGVVAAMNLAHSSRDWLRRFWGDYSIILGAALLVSILDARFGAIACALAAAPLAWQVRHWLRTIRNMKRPAPRVVATTGVVLALLPALPVIALSAAAQA
ncbi:MAG: hypothetical protein AAGE86_00660 [Pseudomonadota bacterium]